MTKHAGLHGRTRLIVAGAARRFDAWQVGRARRAYVSVSGLMSESPGFEGMVEEMKTGWRELDDSARAEADRRVLRAIFFGSMGLSLLRRLFRWAPSRAARLMSSASPVALRFLVGTIQKSGSRRNVVPACEFRSRGGPDLCEHVCRRPTEAFAQDHGIVVRLTPRPASLACDWLWGAPEGDR